MPKSTRHLMLVLIVSLLVFAASYTALNGIIVSNDIQLNDTRAEYEVVSSKNEKLKEELAMAGTDEYIIRVARDDLGMIMPGEYRYIIADN